ncbi:hypothetical protein ANCCAN_06393 [Ancylostoma caninum]|uniref:Uncharacterized protein n=1 Tax=Ancylostoma caninum TaxID=29170 RepID=A0A368GSY4_ANCCA|nr:hypothetical protein ANCCAN_06393 [Ancylostoma caninum]
MTSSVERFLSTVTVSLILGWRSPLKRCAQRNEITLITSQLHK